MKQSIFAIAVTLILLFGSQAYSQQTGTPASTVPSATPTPPRQLFSNDFADVCSGVALSGATTFDKAPGRVHPVMVFTKSDPAETYKQMTGKTPRDWEKLYPDLHQTELVACLTVTSHSLAKSCPFNIDGNEYIVELQNTKYDAKLFESNTGKELAATSFDLKAGNCPMMKFFSQKKEIEHADFKEPLTQFIKPFVQP